MDGTDASYWTCLPPMSWPASQWCLPSGRLRHPLGLGAPGAHGAGLSLHTFSGYLGFAVAPFTIILLAEFLGGAMP